MPIIGGLTRASGYTAPKRRPKTYRAKDAPYAVGGNPGYYVAGLPRPYPINAPQRRVKEAAKACGIRKGMGKSDLMTKMKDCIPGKFGR